MTSKTLTLSGDTMRRAMEREVQSIFCPRRYVTLTMNKKIADALEIYMRSFPIDIRLMKVAS